MLASIAYIILFGLLFAEICKVIHFPPLFGMMVAGILIGPSMWQLLDASILTISPQLRIYFVIRQMMNMVGDYQFTLDAYLMSLQI